MRRIQRLLIVLSALTTLLLFAGCGPAIPTGATSLSPTSTTKSPSSPPSTPTPAVKTGPIALYTNSSLYQAGDALTVTLSNGSNQAIYFPDHLTNCTVILLQRSKAQPLANEGGPAGIDPCQLTIATHIHSLGAGQRLVVRLVAPKSGWPAGLYVATLRYRLSPSAGPSIPLSSPAFAVGSRAPQP